MGTLYLVATPIGNLEDISARALRMLREVRLIAAEDTRHTRKLLAHYGIKTPATSYHEHSKQHKMAHLLAALEAGDIALVSDAGTPALSDPGYELVRAAIEAGHTVSPIPGPSAPIAALVTSGLPTDKFVYLGYLPRKRSERRQAISEVAGLPYTLIFLETPHRLLESLADLAEVLGDRQAAVARELTKLHEEMFRGSLMAARAYFGSHGPRGEVTLIVAGASQEKERWPRERVRDLLIEYIQRGDPPAQIASQVAGQCGWPRREVYKLLQEIREAP